MQVILPPELELIEQQDDIYQGKLGELQQAVQVGWEASQRGEFIKVVTVPISSIEALSDRVSTTTAKVSI